MTRPDDPAVEPSVSVVIPTRDRAELVERAVASALGQTEPDVEVIVVDDASATPLEDVWRDPRLRLIRRERAGGPCAARNEGLAAARGEWILFIDDDDQLLPEMIQVSLEAADSSPLPPPVAVLSCSRVEDEQGHAIDVRCPPPALPRGSHWFLDGAGEGRFRSERTMVAPTSVVRSIGGFDERFRAMEDKDFFLRLNSVCSIIGLRRAMYRKLEHRGQKLLGEPLARAEGIRLTLEKHGELIETDRRRHAKLLATMGIGYLLAGRRRSAIAACAHAVARDPWRLRNYMMLIACLAGRRAFLMGSRLRAPDRVT